jgi:predicted RND superfamily exporter protein
MQGKLTMGGNGFRSGFGFGCGCVFGVITALLAALLALAFLGMHMKEQREKHKSQQQWKLTEKIKPGPHDFARPNFLPLPAAWSWRPVVIALIHLHYPSPRVGVEQW